MKNIYTSSKSRSEGLLVAFQFLVITNILLPSTAYAYVDPGSGSVIVTTVLGLIAAVGYTFRKYFYKLRRIISGRSKHDDDSQGKTGSQGQP